MEPLQYERTAAVFWNADDLNRIEEWTEYLAGLLGDHHHKQYGF